ncbi:ABC transporter ATP-binding protein [Dictyobacter formicarum]|uniref:ABC transporter ATP-binding protein n=1 Tax=Dictyobacter formicarum TaxID=2778368 RepID=A0ABQ3V9J1_9CHLR|nr:ABC transporter ATP-binding protein [Dictyobacter formicarum]GHO82166.1 ABC transporter ATP-binding protein [Dictyobacter formicarum]
MDTDLTPIDEQENEELEEALTPLQSEAQDGRRITITASGLSKSFMHKGEEIKAVDDANFTFTERQFITIMGPSGSGKSTLLYLLGGMDQATSGELQIDGVDVGHLSEQQEHKFRREKLGFVFQSFHLLSNMTALENVMLPMQLAGGQTPAYMRERARSLLREVGMNEDRHNHLPGKLSGGQQQRVAIARALANDPSVILADEPTGNLDARTGTRIIELLKKLAEQGKTVIVVTHDRGIARLADVRLEMENGKLKPMPKYIGAQDASTRTVAVKSWDEIPVTIVAEGLSKYFKYRGQTIKAVDKVNFSFKEQQFVTITGPSGSGKSTLLYIMSGLDQATSGDLLVDGVDVRRLAGRKENHFRREKIGFVFQSYHLISNLTALENVMLPMQMVLGKSAEEIRERARNLLFLVGLNEDRHSHLPGKLSGGQQQRVAIARALANDPRVILADEPTGNLDAYNSKRIIELLKKLAEQGKTVVVVTHDRSIARVADVRLEMEDGRLTGMGNQIAPARPITTVRKKKGKKK